MKKLKRVYKALKSDPKEISLNQLIEFLNLTGISKGALSEATYFACMKVLGESIGKLPLKLLQYNDKNGVTSARDHLLFSILKRPNPYMTSTTFWSTVEYNRNHYGNAYVLITGAGSNTKLWILESDKVKPWYDDAKILAETQDIYYVYSKGGKQYVFSSEEVLHFKTSNTFDGITGISVQEQLQSTIQGNIKAQNLLNRMYDSGFTAKAVMQYTGSLSDENVKTFISGIENYAKGALKDEGIENIIPIPLGATLTPLNVKLADNQFVEVKQYSALQIASAFGIKPYQIGDYTKSSYASAEAQQLSFYIDTLLYIIKQYEEEITYKLLSKEEVKSGLHFKFNVAVILRADLKTQIETLSSATGNFIYTPNEARAFLDLEAKEGGDRLLGNGASIPVELTGSQYLNTREKEEVKSWMKDIMEEVMKETKMAV
ncbi:phage portal protein [Clostridium sp. CCUG 7971]|uniref:phage portal protein n=1 Tax=Clostridium sp. CCUG 7971 TaxID=2811414 RepID=UPI001ABB6890|nr:phage portal protein [Clostridium sp. CCUG 7971]MBO3443406.1 phage portal protein [Clostridium sp. CCUG 7971]